MSNKSEELGPGNQVKETSPSQAVDLPKKPVNWQKRIRSFQRLVGTEGLIHTHQFGYLDPSNRRDRGMIDG